MRVRWILGRTPQSFPPAHHRIKYSSQQKLQSGTYMQAENRMVTYQEEGQLPKNFLRATQCFRKEKKKKKKRDNFHKGGSWKLSSRKDSACQSAPSVFVSVTGTYSVEKHWWLFWLQWLHFRVLMCGYYKGRLVFTVEFLVWNKCQISRVLYFPQQWQCVPWQYHSYSQGRMLTLILGVKLMGW